MTGPPFLLWAHLLLIWAVANYISRDPLADDARETEERFGTTQKWRTWVIARSVIAAAVTAYLVSAHLALAVLMLISTICFPLLRRVIPAGRCAEFEVAANTAFALLSLTIVKKGTAQLDRVFFLVPASDNRIAAMCVIFALGLFTIHGGTNIVRGILKKSGAVPTLGDPGQCTVDVKEYNRGRLIGALERVLLLAVVIAGSYEALGFIVAAKGLIRSREFESNRDMTEYFLIGSLASVLVAVATGSVAKILIHACW